MSMNWLIDRLLVLGIVLVLAGAVAGLSMAGIRHAGAACGSAALVASLLTVWLIR